MGKIQKAIAAIYAEKQEMGKIRQKDLAKALGCSQATVSHILNGSRTLSEKWIEALCEKLDISLGDIEEINSRAPDPEELRECYVRLKCLYETRYVPGFRSVSRNIDDWLEDVGPGRALESHKAKEQEDSSDFVRESTEIAYLDSDQPRPVAMVRIRHYDAIPAGDPRDMNPDGQMWIDIVHSKVRESWYTLRVMGDSMSPDFLDGDIVMMDYARQPRDGDIVAALIDGHESTLKTYSRHGDEITLTPIETKHHAPYTFHASRVSIQGVLIEIVRRIPKRNR
jgi:SOS-response transcriptional repressor LexA